MIERQPSWRRPLSAAALLLALVSCSVHAGDEACVGGTGDCFVKHDEPGCDFEECCEIVCALDPSCCAGPWDAFCAEIATLECEPPPCPGDGGDCFASHDGAGCDDLPCCSLVCGLDPFCCDGVWDAICAEVATVGCAAGFCTIDPCPPDALLEPELCGEDLNGGCGAEPFLFSPIACGDVYCGTVRATGIRDTDWYELTITEETNIVWSATSEFPALLGLVTGDCETGFAVQAVGQAGGCEFGALAYCASPGTVYLVIGPGTTLGSLVNGIACEDPKIEPGVVGNRYTASLSCDACPGPCPEDLDGDGSVEVDDLLRVIGAWGQSGVPEDLDGDGSVDVDDLLLVVGAWGPCPAG